MMDVHTGAIDRDTRNELADRQLHRRSQTVLTPRTTFYPITLLVQEEIRW
jgi:hypothetical protein